MKTIAGYPSEKYFFTEMGSEYGTNTMDYGIGNPNPGLSGVEVVETTPLPGRIIGPAMLVNLTVDRLFDYRTLYKLTSLSLKSGGMLEYCNGQIAMFHFPTGGVMGFLEEVGYLIRIGKSLVSHRESGGSVVNVKFQDPVSR